MFCGIFPFLFEFPEASQLIVVARVEADEKSLLTCDIFLNFAQSINFLQQSFCTLYTSILIASLLILSSLLSSNEILELFPWEPRIYQFSCHGFIIFLLYSLYSR